MQILFVVEHCNQSLYLLLAWQLLDSVSRKPNAAECSDALQHYNKHKNRYEDRVPCKYY